MTDRKSPHRVYSLILKGNGRALTIVLISSQCSCQPGIAGVVHPTNRFITVFPWNGGRYSREVGRGEPRSFSNERGSGSIEIPQGGEDPPGAMLQVWVERGVGTPFYERQVVIRGGPNGVRTPFPSKLDVCAGFEMIPVTGEYQEGEWCFRSASDDTGLQMERPDYPPTPSNFCMSAQLQAETGLPVGHAVTRGACDPGKWYAGWAVSLRRRRQR